MEYFESRFSRNLRIHQHRLWKCGDRLRSSCWRRHGNRILHAAHLQRRNPSAKRQRYFRIAGLPAISNRFSGSKFHYNNQPDRVRNHDCMRQQHRESSQSHLQSDDRIYHAIICYFNVCGGESHCAAIQSKLVRF